MFGNAFQTGTASRSKQVQPAVPYYVIIDTHHTISEGQPMMVCCTPYLYFWCLPHHIQKLGVHHTISEGQPTMVCCTPSSHSGCLPHHIQKLGVHHTISEGQPMMVFSTPQKWKWCSEHCYKIWWWNHYVAKGYPKSGFGVNNTIPKKWCREHHVTKNGVGDTRKKKMVVEPPYIPVQKRK